MTGDSAESVRKCCCTSNSVGAISAACVPASAARNIAISATSVLPEPTSPCSSRSIGRGEAMSASISASARVCEAVGWKPKRRSASAR